MPRFLITIILLLTRALMVRLQTLSHYDVLGLEPNATHTDIKNAYRKLALQYHPDKAMQNGISKSEAEEQFRTLHDAYEALISSEKENQHTLTAEPEPSQVVDIHIYTRTGTVTMLTSPQFDFLANDDIAELEAGISQLEFKSSWLLHHVLYVACRDGKKNAAIHMIENLKYDPHAWFIVLNEYQHCYYNGPLFKIAVLGGNLELVKYLHEKHHTNIDSRSRNQEDFTTALEYAVSFKHLHIAQYLIEQGADVNPVITPFTLIHRAIHNEDLAMLQLLVRSGSHIEDEDLETAILTGSPELVEYLLKARHGLESYRFKDPIGYAITRSGNLNLLKLLNKNKSFDLYHSDDGRTSTELDFLFLKGAAESGHFEMMKYLVEELGLLYICKDNPTYVYDILSSASDRYALENQNHLVSVEERLKLIRYLVEEHHLTLSELYVRSILMHHNLFDEQLIRYFQNMIPMPESVKKIYEHLSAGRPLKSLSLKELFALYNYERKIQPRYHHGIDFLHTWNTKEIIESYAITAVQLAKLAKESPSTLFDILYFYVDQGGLRQDDRPMLMALLDLGLDPNVADDLGQSLLLRVMDKNYRKSYFLYDEVEFLIDYGADPFLTNSDGECAYDIIKHNSRSNEYFSILENRWPVIQSVQNIFLSNKPLLQGGRVESITRKQFKSRFGYDYADRVLNATRHQGLDKIKEDVSGHLSSHQLKEKLKQILKKPRKDLVISKINDDVGFGVFAKGDIAKDEVLCFYGGHLVPVKQTDGKYESISYYGADLMFSNEHFRGIASFFQHLPREPRLDFDSFHAFLKLTGQDVSMTDLKLNDELYSINFKSNKVKSKLATENIRLEYINYQNAPLILLVTSRNIRAGEQLGFQYGYHYWLRRNKPPVLFDTVGKVLPRNAYKRNFWQLQFDDFTYTGSLKPLIEKIKQKEQMIVIKGDDGKRHKVSSTQLFNELVRVNAIDSKTPNLSQAKFTIFGINDLKEKTHKDTDEVSSFKFEI